VGRLLLEVYKAAGFSRADGFEQFAALLRERLVFRAEAQPASADFNCDEAALEALEPELERRLRDEARQLVDDTGLVGGPWSRAGLPQEAVHVRLNSLEFWVEHVLIEAFVRDVAQNALCLAGVQHDLHAVEDGTSSGQPA
jgi:hypothetical protein